MPRKKVWKEGKKRKKMNVFWREMKASRKSLIIWCFGVIFMVASGMNKYASLSSSSQSMNDLMADMPKSFQVLMGTGTFDLSKASGYYGMLYLYLLVMATIHAAILGASLISKEERDKTSEFLFVKPVSRNKILTAKLLAAFVNILILNLITLFSSILIVQKYSKGEEVSTDIVVLMAGMLILQLLYLLIGTAIAAVNKHPKTATSLSTGILLITFILSIVIDLNKKMEFLKYFTPFKYYEAKKLMYGGGFDAIYVVLSVVIITALIIITYVFFNKRDLNV
jgi:ABC-2 type transport system permease protein